mgnify:CR=1 FL=1
MPYTYEELKKKTVEELREIARGGGYRIYEGRTGAMDV